MLVGIFVVIAVRVLVLLGEWCMDIDRTSRVVKWRESVRLVQRVGSNRLGVLCGIERGCAV